MYSYFQKTKEFMLKRDLTLCEKFYAVFLNLDYQRLWNVPNVAMSNVDKDQNLNITTKFNAY